jgi:hypothetical protein
MNEAEPLCLKPQIPPDGPYNEPQIFAVNKKMSVARQSTGTLKTLFTLKGE